MAKQLTSDEPPPISKPASQPTLTVNKITAVVTNIGDAFPIESMDQAVRPRMHTSFGLIDKICLYLSNRLGHGVGAYSLPNISPMVLEEVEHTSSNTRQTLL